MKLKLSDKAIKRIAKKTRGQEESDYQQYAFQDEEFEGMDDVDLAIMELDSLRSDVAKMDPNSIQAKLLDIKNLLAALPKKRAQVPTLEELDETFEMDEAHQEFMQGENKLEEAAKMIGKYIDSKYPDAKEGIPPEELEEIWEDIKEHIFYY